MSYYNGSLPGSEYWAGYVAQAEMPSTPRLALLAMVNIPVIAIVFNILWQLVRALFLPHVLLLTEKNAYT